MSIKSLHFFLSSIERESRLFKEASYLLENHIASNVTVFGLWEDRLRHTEVHSSGLQIIRYRTTVKLLRAKGYFQNPGMLRKLFAALALFQYFFAAVVYAMRQKPDAISVHNLALLPLGAVAAKFTSAKLIYAPHELETKRTGLHGWNKKLSTVIEKIFISRSDEIVVVCDPIAKWYSDKYDLKNVHVIRNLPSSRDVEKEPGDNRLFREKFKIPDDRIIFIYQGLIDQTRGISELITLFRSSDHHIVFMGYGDSAMLVENSPESNIHYQPSVSPHEIVNYTSSADIGIIFFPGAISLSYQYCLPNKFLEYLHAGIPLIVNDNLVYLAELIKHNDLGWVVTENAASSIIEAIALDEAKSKTDNINKFVKDWVWETDAPIYRQIYSRRR